MYQESETPAAAIRPGQQENKEHAHQLHFSDITSSGYLQPIFHAIPAELKAHRQWVTWKAKIRGGKKSKVLYDPRTGKRAGSIYCWTWGTFQAAVDAMRRRRHDGIGFVFTVEDPFIGIDLDHVTDQAGRIIVPWAAKVVKALSSYTERSVSGDGLHVIVRGKIPRSGKQPGASSNSPHIEIYQSSRYFCMTGNIWGENALQD